MEVGYQIGNYSISLDPVVVYRYTVDVGSALATSYQHRSLKEVIRAANHEVDLDHLKFIGGNMQPPNDGSYIDGQGNLRRYPRESMPADELPTPYSTIILSLSAQMSRTQLSPILARAIIFATHGPDQVGRNEMAQAKVIEGTIAKYATTVLSANSMFATKALHQKAIEELLAGRFPEGHWHTLFFPPRRPVEEIDYALFLTKMLSRTADNEVVYIRSMKLLGLALLLSKYGWMINISIELLDGSTHHVLPIGGPAVGALNIIHSFVSSETHPSRSYLENHSLTLPRSFVSRRIHRTANSSVGNMSEVLSLALTGNRDDASRIQRAFDMVRDVWQRDYTVGPLLQSGGRVRVALLPRARPDRLTPSVDEKSIGRFLEPYIGGMPRVFKELASDVIARLHPGYDWDALLQHVQAGPYRNATLLYMARQCEGDTSKFWMAHGTLLGLIDSFARTIINVTDETHIRFPIDSEISIWQPKIEGLMQTGLLVPDAVVFCTMWYAGVSEDVSKVALRPASSNILGYWDGEQGILATPIFERTLYCDLPEDKARPLTLHNTPIIGMATDDSGWIRPGSYPAGPSRVTPMKSLRKKVFNSTCAVIVEYRPYFEHEITQFVAGVYIGGVFHGSMPLDASLNCDIWHVSSCSHEYDHTANQSQAIPPHLTIDLSELEGEELVSPDSEENEPPHVKALILPQTSNVSRFFSGALASSWMPVLQTGCLDCALEIARRKNRMFIIPRATPTTTALAQV